MKSLTAFEKYLLALPRQDAALYVIHCLTNGPSDNDAWGLMAEFNGDEWRVKPEQMRPIVERTIISLELKSIGGGVG